MRALLLSIIFLVNYTAYSQWKYDISPNRYRFKHRSVVFKGSRMQITSQLRSIKNGPKFSGIPEEIQTELNKLFVDAKSQAFPRVYKRKAIRFLNALYKYEEFVILYNGALNDVVEKLKRDIKRIDFKLEKQYVKAKTAVERIEKEDPDNRKEIDSLAGESKKSKTRLVSHRWMKKKFEEYKGINMIENPDHLITEFKKREAAYIFSIYEEKQLSEIRRYLENEIIDFYYKKAIAEIDLNQLELLYINRYQ